MRRLDQIITGGILVLVFFTPLAMGGVHPWAFSLMETVIFLMVVVWMAKVRLLYRTGFAVRGAAFRPLIVPLAAFVGIALFQMVPLPPGLLRILSPATYEVYSTALPGWPDKSPYRQVAAAPRPAGGREVVVLPTPQEVKNGAPVPFAPPKTSPRSISAGGHPGSAGARGIAPRSGEGSGAGVSRDAPAWRPLSLAPSLTKSLLLKFTAYASLFLLILFYPFGMSSDRTSEIRFLRRIIVSVLIAGLVIAALGILEQATWNGKILWSFVPYDWGNARELVSTRARGPFVNPDHFANYLILILPLAAAGAVFRTFLSSSGDSRAFRIFCGVTAFIIVAAVVMSLSRAGWIGSILGVAILIGSCLRMPREKRPAVLRLSRRAGVAVGVAGSVGLLLMVSIFIGPQSRSHTDVRIGQTVAQDRDFAGRVPIWKDSLRLAADFPIFGVGLGSWGELFPRYQRPPWSPVRVREAHNDYLQLLTETGLVGFVLLGWFFIVTGRRLYTGYRRLPTTVLPVAAALIAALAVMAFHEFFDFPLQIPANAMLFVLILAIALRMVAAGGAGLGDASSGGRFSTLALTAMISAGALVLAALALAQPPVPYPYNLEPPLSVAETRDLILAHPASARLHLARAWAIGRGFPTRRSRELRIALWLEPANPFARDLYAQDLIRRHRRKAALKEITRSLTVSPTLGTHFYLRGRILPWLSAAERAAIEAGIKTAIGRRYDGASAALGSFYDVLGLYAKEAATFADAARAEPDPAVRSRYLDRAGFAWLRSDHLDEAERASRDAIRADPTNPAPYQHLTAIVADRDGTSDAARAIVTSGIRRGAAPFPLYVSLAEVQRKLGELPEAEASLRRAVDLRPRDFGAVRRLAFLYMEEKKFDRAALWMRRATEIKPLSADAYFQLGIAEDRSYRFPAAEKAFSRAISLAPGNAGFRAHLRDFRRRVARNMTHRAPTDGVAARGN